MDLYADLPLAKGAKTSSALDADGKPKTSLSSAGSVWTSAPLMVPQVAKNKRICQPAAVVTSSTPMLPTTLAVGKGKSPTRSDLSLAFQPASVSRKATTANQRFCKRQQEEQESSRPVGKGLGYVAATEVVVMPVQHQHEQEEEMDADLCAAAGHFFQATYRDEYNPARPNSYEVYCKEREDRKKMDKVKKELNRRQREQEREGKLEREQLAKDLAEGRAPAMKLLEPAGRGRSMTMPAWMRKKIKENASVVSSQPESERDVDWDHQLKRRKGIVPTNDDQFENAREQQRSEMGYSKADVGFSASKLLSKSSSKQKEIEPIFRSHGKYLHAEHDNSKARVLTERRHSHELELDEFGRKVRREPKRKNEDDCDKRDNCRDTTSSFNDNRRDDRYSRSESNPYDENRQRVSSWDKRSLGQPFTSRVVLLQNMVGPGEVDAELQDEVKGECCETYGPVTKCMIYEVTESVSPEEAVRIFVQFKNAEDATKALTGLNGRFFGGRKVKAVYYDEGRFEQMDLTTH